MSKPSTLLVSLQSVRIRTKLIGVGIAIALLAVIPMILVAMYSLDSFDTMAKGQTDRLINDNLDQLANNVYRLVEAQDEGVQNRVNDDLSVARHVIEAEGGISICDGEATWEAVDQSSRETISVTLPRLCVGETWLGQNSDFTEETPIVDEVKSLVGSVSTVFQRMNEQGDMLRVATTVPKSESERALGTYIPATNSDGTPNPVVSALLRGETYRGIAYVWDGWYVTAYEPIQDEAGELIGALFVGVNPNDFLSLSETIERMEVGTSGYVYVLGGEGDDRGHYIISHNGERNGENLWDAQDADGRYFVREIVESGVALQPGELTTVRYPWQNPGESEARWKVARIAYYEPWDWVIGVSTYEDDYAQLASDLAASRTQLIGITVLIGIGIAVLAAVVAWFVARGIANPLAHTVRIANALAQGDFSQRVALHKNDETGMLARAFDSMAENLQRMLEAERESRAYLENTITVYMEFVGRVARGDLTVHAGENGTGKQEEALDDLARLGANLNKMVESLAGMTRTIRDISTSVMSASNHIEQASAQQMESSSVQNAAVTETMAAMEQVRATVNQTAERAQAVAQLAGQSVEVSRTGQEAIADTLQGMQLIQTQVESIAATITTLSERTQQIGQIIATVNEIADQSKLLALNAEIESARAGTEGRGFAVVAMEVRQLAEQSREATARIRGILGEIQQATESAVVVTEEGSKRAAHGIELVARAGQSIQELASVIDDAAQAVTQIAASTHQQRTGIEQLAVAMRSATEASTQSAGSARQTEQSAHDLNGMATQLQQAVARYKLN